MVTDFRLIGVVIKVPETPSCAYAIDKHSFFSNYQMTFINVLVLQYSKMHNMWLEPFFLFVNVHCYYMNKLYNRPVLNHLSCRIWYRESSEVSTHVVVRKTHPITHSRPLNCISGF